MSNKSKSIFSSMYLIYLLVWSYCWYRVVYYFNQSHLSIFILGSLFIVTSLLLQFKRTGRLKAKKAHGFIEKCSYFSYSLIIWYLFFAITLDILLIIDFIFPFISPLVLYNLHLALFFVPLILLVWGRFNIELGPIVERIKISKSSESNTLLKIAQISDLHVGVFIQDDYLKKVNQKLDDLNADLLVLTGDIVDTVTDTIPHELEVLASKSYLYGKYYVLGNHEYYWGHEKWLSFFEKHGFTVLLNSGKEIVVEGKKLWIGGVTDQIGKKFHPTHETAPERTINKDISYDYKIALSHRPELAESFYDLGYNLILSGHTHGGQFFPFTLLVGFFNSYVKGLNQFKDMNIYVSRGTGFWGFPCRLGSQAEISLIELKF